MERKEYERILAYKNHMLNITENFVKIQREKQIVIWKGTIEYSLEPLEETNKRFNPLDNPKEISKFNRDVALRYLQANTITLESFITK